MPPDHLEDCKNQQCPAHVQSFCNYRFEKIDSALEKIDAKLTNIEKYIFVGNGVPSIKSRLETIENDHKTHKDEEASRAKVIYWILGAIGVVVIGIAVPKLLPLIAKGFTWLFSSGATPIVP